MVLMAVRDQDRFDLVCAILEVSEIWNHELDAKVVEIRKEETAVNNQDFVLILEDHAVHSDFA
jgi:hypothetical protein